MTTEGRYKAVADWSQARIGYTENELVSADHLVADWSQARIGYTLFRSPCGAACVADWSQARIGYTRREVADGR